MLGLVRASNPPTKDNIMTTIHSNNANDVNQSILRAAHLIYKADAVLITAGAGMGVDSGLPDFRGDKGFWNAYPAYAKLGVSFSGMANPRRFKDDPSFGWGFYGQRLNLYRKTTPHEGFNILRRIGNTKKAPTHVFTSNVDGAFQKAGFSTVTECHGSIHHLQCMNYGCKGGDKKIHHFDGQGIWSAGLFDPRVNTDTMRASGPFPGCTCGSIARPNILMFSDLSWDERRTERQHDILNNWESDLAASHKNICVIELGAGTSIPTVRVKSETVASERGNSLVRINIRESEINEDLKNAVGIPLGALDALTRIETALKEKSSATIWLARSVEKAIAGVMLMIKKKTP
jgi:NAD-dependent SIR2 family protein deacetylase